jgi:hypothetical protein
VSSSTVILGGFGTTTQRNRWSRDLDDAFATTLKNRNDDVKVTIDLTDYLASAETVSSVVYTDSGATTSAKSVSSPSVIFTITGIGETEVAITLSTGRRVTQIFRTYLAEGKNVHDYND